MRSKNIDFLKGMLIYTVVVGHMIQFWMYDNEGFWSDSIFKIIYIFHMPLFMAISGFLAYSSLNKTKDIYGIFLKAKAYIIPVFFWAVIFQLFKYNQSPSEEFFIDIIKRFVGSFWFIWSLFGSVSISIIIFIVCSENSTRFVACLVSFFLVLLLPDIGNIYLFQYTYPYFIFGLLVCHLKSHSKIKIDKSLFWFVFSLFLIPIFYFWDENSYIYVSKMSSFNVSTFRYFSGLIVGIIAVKICSVIYNYLPILVRLFIEKTGEGTIYIYILSGIMFEIVPSVSWFGDFNSELIKYGMVIISSIVITYLCWLVGIIFSYSKYLDKLLFGKNHK